METRLRQLSQLHNYVEVVDKEITMISQSLQWDRRHLLEVPSKSVCSYDNHHRLPQENLKIHEEKCFLKSQCYMKDDQLLPDPLDINANTMVKLSTQDILKIINDASLKDPLFKKGNVRRFTEPLSLERLQFTYTADERRAIHDAVVQAVPSCHDLADLALPSADCEKGVKSKEKSRAEILAELRNMKRRRPKYRVAAKSRNYSDVLRDVIKTQMEFYSDAVQSEDTGSMTSKNPHDQENNETIQREMKRNENDYETLKYQRSTSSETFSSKNVRRNDYSKRNIEDRRKRSDYYESNRGERERKTENRHLNRMESSATNEKDRQRDYYKPTSYKRNRENESHVRDKSNRVRTTRSDYREEQRGRRNKRYRDREPRQRTTGDELTNVESPESDFNERDKHSKHRKSNGNGDYYERKSKKRRKHNDYYNLNRDETGRRKRRSVKKERDASDRQSTSKSSRNDSFNSNREVHLPIKVEKIEPEEEESASREKYNASSYVDNHDTRMISVKVEKPDSADSESTRSSSSSSYSSYSSSSYTETEEERSTRRERYNDLTERRAERVNYPNTYKNRDWQSTSANERHVAIKTERLEGAPRYEKTHNVYYTSSNQSNNRGNPKIKVEKPYFQEVQGRVGQTAPSKYTSRYADESERSGEVRENYNQPVYYGSSTGSRTWEGSRRSSLYYSGYGEEWRGEENLRTRGGDVYGNDRAYARYYTDDGSKWTHNRHF